jgi:hypothetical protein
MGGYSSMDGLITVLVLNLIATAWVYFKSSKQTKVLSKQTKVLEESLNTQISFNVTQQKQIDTLLTTVMNMRAKL